MRIKKTMLTAALVVVGLATAGPAAAVTPAYWSPADGTPVTMKGNLTMVQNSMTYTCPNFTWQVNVSNISASGPMAAWQLSNNTCTRAGINYTITTNPGGLSFVDPNNPSAYVLRTFGSSITYVALGGATFTQTAATVPYINGSGTTPSRLVFNNTHIGSGILVTGTLDVKVTATGGLVTLSW